MIWTLKDRSVRRPADLPDHIERRLRFALARFGRRVERIFVFLEDPNGPKGGVDKTCRMLVKTRGCGVVVVSETAAEWLTAVDRATTRLGYAVARQIERLRQRSTSSPRFPSPGREEAVPA